MEDIRKSVKLTSGEIYEKLINVTEEDFKASFMYELFGSFMENGESKVNPYDLIVIPPGKYGKDKNKNSFTTTVGIWLFNKFFIEPGLFDLFGYINHNITGGSLDKINQDLSYALMEDRIPIDTMKNYLMKTQFIMQFVTMLSPNHSEKILTCTKAIDKKKEELFNKYKDQLQAGDVHTINMVEKELLDFAVEYVGDDPSMDTYLSGARGNIKNHFKNLYVMKGAVRDPDPNTKQEYHVAMSNYIDGISPEEYVLYANSASTGPYKRGNKTSSGGYMENLFAMGYQDIVLDKPGTDCGCGRTSTVYLTADNVKYYMYNNIVLSNGTMVELTSQNMNKYIGKKVQMRFAKLCKNEKICNACAGNFFYRYNPPLLNVGLALMQVPSAFKNKSMKAFHDSTIKTTEMNVMKAFGLE